MDRVCDWGVGGGGRGGESREDEEKCNIYKSLLQPCCVSLLFYGNVGRVNVGSLAV